VGRKLRVAIVHSFYRSENPSGENVTVLRQRDLLAKNGVDVELFSVHTDDLQLEKHYELKTAVNFTLGRGIELRERIASFKPSLVHVHNLFPNISETDISQLKIPYVMTVHNYRFLCANGSFFRDSQPCFDCVSMRSIPSVIHGCYHESRVATVPLAVRNFRPIKRRPIFKNAAKIVFPSEYSQKVFTQDGEATNSTVIYQPGPELRPIKSIVDNHRNDRWLFIGRLTVEKGLRELLNSWPTEKTLGIIGSGPLEEELHRIAAARQLHVDFLGSMPHEQALDELAKSRGLVFCSQWPEVAPLVYAESLGLRKPVISTGENAVSDWVNKHGTGAVVNAPSPEAWSASIAIVERNYEALSNRCFETFQKEFSETTWINNISSLYLGSLEQFNK